MALYLNTNDGLILYNLGEYMSDPVRCTFLVSDADISENEYQINYANGESDTITLKLVTTHNDKFYYSLPWKTIQSIEAFQIDGPNYKSSCCDELNQKLDVLYGQSDQVNQVSATGGPDGTLCWNAFGFFGSPEVYSIALGADDFSEGGLTLNTSAIFESPKFRYTTETGECYEGIFARTISVCECISKNKH